MPNRRTRFSISIHSPPGLATDKATFNRSAQTDGGNGASKPPVIGFIGNCFTNSMRFTDASPIAWESFDPAPPSTRLHLSPQVVMFHQFFWWGVMKSLRRVGLLVTHGNRRGPWPGWASATNRAHGSAR